MSRRILRPLIVLLAVAIGALAVAGCGSTSGSGSALYTPAAYYQSVNGVNDCYYAASPAEVSDLINAGLCPVNSVATIMPVSWEQEYFAYYSSPAYYDTYMPVSYRSRYTSVTVVKFSKTYSKQINTAESHAVYKSSTGAKVTGTSKLKFGTGSTGSGTSKTVHGGGSGSGAGACSLSMTAVRDKGGSSTSHGGGSGSKSGTTTKSKTGSGSKGGC